jgi:hypothetical protein
MNVREILVEWLTAHGYDGLFSETIGCACELSDLCPNGCDDIPLDCEPGYKALCDEWCTHEDVDYEPGAGQWHIQAEKPEVEP